MKILFRSDFVRAGVFHQRTVVRWLDRREVAMGDEFRPCKFGDVIRAGAQRQIDDLAR